MLRATLAALAALLLGLAPAASFAFPQDPVPDEEEDLLRLDAWPEVPKSAAKALKTDVQRLRKAKTETMESEAREALIALGAAAGPSLIAGLGKERDEAARARIIDVLDAITGAPHTRLLAAEFGHKSQVVRTWSMMRAAGFADPGILAESEAAFAKASKVKDPEKVDRAERLAAALVATSAGSHAALEHLAARAPKVWGEHGPAFRTALESVRGEKATAIVAPGLQGERVEIIAALNLLAGCGGKDAVALVRPMLDNNDNSIRIAAINALRGIVDGDPPLDRLPVFEAIEVANAWKARV